jgi:hypothetical protein
VENLLAEHPQPLDDRGAMTVGENFSGVGGKVGLSIRPPPVAGNKTAGIDFLDLVDDLGAAAGAAPIINVAPRDCEPRDEPGVWVVTAPSVGARKIAIGVRLSTRQVRAVGAQQHVSVGAAENGAALYLLVRYPEPEL